MITSQVLYQLSQGGVYIFIYTNLIIKSQYNKIYVKDLPKYYLFPLAKVMINIMAKMVAEPKIINNIYPPVLNKYRILPIFLKRIKLITMPPIEVMVSKIPRTTYKESNESCVESINPCTVPAAYKNKESKHIRNRKIDVRPIKMGSSLSLKFSEKAIPIFLACGNVPKAGILMLRLILWNIKKEK